MTRYARIAVDYLDESAAVLRASLEALAGIRADLELPDDERWTSSSRRADELATALEAASARALPGLGDVIEAGGHPVLVDGLGAAAFVSAPAGELGILLDVVGRMNKSAARVEHRFLFAPGQAAELTLAILQAVAETGHDGAAAHRARFIEALQVLGSTLDEGHDDPDEGT